MNKVKKLNSKNGDEKDFEKSDSFGYKINEPKENFLRINDDAWKINDYSAGLSFAIPDGKILGDYNDVLGAQNMALNSVSQMSKNFQIGNELVSLMDEAVLPMASAVANIGLVSANAAKLYGIGSINNEQFKLAQDISGL